MQFFLLLSWSWAVAFKNREGGKKSRGVDRGHSSFDQRDADLRWQDTD